MSLTKKLMVVAAGAALTAAMAVPAMALENEFHGMFAVRGYNSNYLSGTAGRINIDGDSKTTNNWIEQRARIFYTAKANDNLKLVTGFELDSYWGKTSYTTGRNSGGALGSDSVNLETKWVYLDFNDPFAKANFKVGIQALNDDYKNLVVGIGADAAGVQVNKTIGPVATRFGWFRLDDRNAAAAAPTTLDTGAGFTNGKATRDLMMLGGTYSLNKDLKVGATYYFLNSDNAFSGAVPTGAAGPQDYNVHIVGANAAANVGIASVDGFAIYEFGTNGPTHISAYAGNVATAVKVGPGKAKISALYVSGNNSTTFGGNSFVSVNNTTSGVFTENGQGALGNMFILVRNPKETTNEQAIVSDSSNQNQGIIGGSVGYDLAIDKTFASANIGMAATAKDNKTRSSNYLGTEINAEVGYKLYDNMSALVRGAYVILGDYYKGKGTAGTDPANPYVAQLVLTYTF